MVMFTLPDILAQIGEAGRRLSDLGATAGAAGNLSVYLRGAVAPSDDFPNRERVDLPVAVPELAGGALLITGSGVRLREIATDPTLHLALLIVEEGGKTGWLHTAPRRRFDRLTVECNSHLAVHQDRVARTGQMFHALIHAQPFYLTFLSHIPRCQSSAGLSRSVLRWQPETIYHLPEGIAYLPFLLPTSSELMAANIEALRTHQVALWAKHGVMARSDDSVSRACDLIEYAEVGARFECQNLMANGSAEGLTTEEIRTLCRAFDIEQSLF